MGWDKYEIANENVSIYRSSGCYFNGSIKLLIVLSIKSGLGKTNYGHQ